MALLETLTDNFNDNSRDGSLWLSYGSLVSETGQQLSFTTQVSHTTYSGYYSRNTYDATGSYAYIEIVQRGSTSIASLEVIPVIISQNNSNEVMWLLNSTNIIARQVVAGVITNLATTTFNAITHRYLRIRESGGTTYWDYSANASTWTNFYSKANPITMTAVSAENSVGTYSNEASTTTVILDNFNVNPNLTGTPVYAAISNANPYASGKLRKYAGSGWSDVATSDLFFRTYSSDGNTTVNHLSEDPSTMMQSIISRFNALGGGITYDGGSIDITGTTVSYTFNTQTVLEAIAKTLELAPNTWYWYVDPATNLLHFHAKNTTADHTFTLGKDVLMVGVEKRTEDIINTVYFTGGDVAGTPLFKKYQNSSSVGLYGVRAYRYQDERVTLAATASTIANRILDLHNGPEIRLTLEVADSNIGAGGFDIDSITIGDVVNIRNVKGNSASSLWDVAVWDDDRWDFNIAQLSTMYLQITRLDRYPDRAVLYCSTLPPDIAKRIEDINRNLEASQTAQNPASPS